MYEEAELPAAKVMPKANATLKPVAKAQPVASKPPVPAHPPPAVLNLQRVVAGPGCSPSEPLCVVVDHVSPDTLKSFSAWELAQLDFMVQGGPFYQCFSVNGRPSFKQESRSSEPTAGLMLWYHDDKDEQDHAGWYLSAQPFAKIPTKSEKVLQ